MSIWGRWTRYRRTQRARMDSFRARDLGFDDQPPPEYREPGRPRETPEPERPDVLQSTLALATDTSETADTAARRGEPTTPSPPTDAPSDTAPTDASGEDVTDTGTRRSKGPRRDFGPSGTPFNRQSPFYVGFVGAVGVLTAYAVVQAVGRLGTVITLLVVSLFLTLSLNPLVEALTRRRFRRGAAVGIVFLGVLAVFTLVGWLVIPPVAQQATELTTNAPRMFDNLLANPWVQDVDHRYQLVQRIQEEVNKRVADGNLWAGVFGGVLDAGKIIASGVFSVLTVLVLTLYFLASLPAVKQAAYALVPASRRPRTVSLAEEVMRRVGSYAIGQVAVAAINAFCAWIMMTLIGLKFAAVLAVAVGFLGLIPMVGATLGASVVAIVAFFDEPKKALIVIIYFIVYQQIENYAVMPRIMQRTVAVPGAVTVVAALAGGALLGILGALLAIPFAAGALLLYEEVLVPRQRRH
ncbi:AI-2E family transporter [Terrabacter sp. BE26]|uniref:AI-2E family transporter n=1 Tax=Terrabacter sp. BE26 TaxID=2898152 RepID=UPI0035BE8CA3